VTARSQGGRLPLVALATLGVALVGLPLVALLLRVDWPGLPARLASPMVWPAVRLSLVTTAVTTLLAVVLGTPLAWLLSRSRSRWAGWVRAVVTVPLVLPPVVGGVALLMAYGRNGIVGMPVAHLFGISVPFTPVAVVAAQTFVSMPFYVVAVEGAMRSLDGRYDQVAATLGAGPLRVFTRVAVPLAWPGIAAGAALAWARALGEFGATITFAGNFTGTTQTAPLAVYVALDSDPEVALALSVVMLVVCVAVLGLLRGRWLR
jgi:molybdate transport system permease protein